MQSRLDPHFACIDLFCGCGGNSWGMLSEDNFPQLPPLLALDCDPVAMATYHWNIPSAEVIIADIRTVHPEDIMRRVGIRAGELGCLIASPPCQTYSRNNRKPKDRDDLRNTLYKQVLRMIKYIRPWIVFMENVPDLQGHQDGEYHHDVLRQLDSMGYVVRHWVVDAAEFGVPQHRQRLIYLAFHKDMQLTPVRPMATHGESEGLLPWVTVGDAISDLPERQAGDNCDWFSIYADQGNHPYQQARRARVQGLIYNHGARELSDIQLQRLRALTEGQAYRDLPANLKPKNGYKASYGRLWRTKPAQTLTTYLAYPGCGRFSHYEQDRVITIREALRLQSFDDRFRVLGKVIDQSAQVGNAVPPILAQAFRREIVRALESYFGTINISNPMGVLQEVC